MMNMVRKLTELSIFNNFEPQFRRIESLSKEFLSLLEGDTEEGMSINFNDFVLSLNPSITVNSTSRLHPLDNETLILCGGFVFRNEVNAEWSHFVPKGHFNSFFRNGRENSIDVFLVVLFVGNPVLMCWTWTNELRSGIRAVDWGREMLGRRDGV
jgi:hypothetical protein